MGVAAAIGTFSMEKGGELLFEKIKEFGKNIIKRGKLIRKLKKEISFLLNNQSNMDFLNNALFNVFDDNNIKRIVDKIIDSNGYDFVMIFSNEIEKKLDGCELDYDAVKRIQNYLMVNLIKYLKKKDPDFYNNYINDANYQRLINVDKDIKTLLNVNKNIYKLLNSPKVYNIYTYEKDLKKSTKPSIDLGFFEQQNDSLIKYIKEKIKQNVIKSRYFVPLWSGNNVPLFN